MSGVTQQARELLAGITPGPWGHEEAFSASFVCAGDASRTVAESWIVRLDNRPGRVKDKRDAEFIAASPQLVAELADEVERLRGTLFLIQEAHVDYDAALNRREHGAVAAGRFMRTVFDALDDLEADRG